MSERNHEERNRNEYRYGCHQDRYHTVVKGCTDSLDTDELRPLPLYDRRNAG